MCEVGVIIDGIDGFSNVIGGPFDGLYIQGSDPENPTHRCGWKIVVNSIHQYTWCFVREVWEYEGLPTQENGFTVLKFRLPVEV